MKSTFGATLVWMGLVLVSLPFAFVPAGPVVGLLIAAAAFVGLLALFERRLLPDGHEGLNLWGGLAAAGGAFAIGLALPALLTALGMTVVEGIGPDEAGAHAAADVFVFREGRVRSEFSGRATDADGREMIVSPLVGAAWQPDQPVRVWLVSVEERTGLPAPADPHGEAGIGLRLPERLVGPAMQAVRSADDAHPLQAHPEPIFVEGIAARPLAAALAEMKVPLLLTILLVGAWALGFRFFTR